MPIEDPFLPNNDFEHGVTLLQKRVFLAGSTLTNLFNQPFASGNCTEIFMICMLPCHPCLNFGAVSWEWGIHMHGSSIFLVLLLSRVILS